MSSRKFGLDVLKFICSFMVICIHIPFPEPVNTIVLPITRIAVPIFFMITGYFYSVTKERNSQVRQIKKIAKLFLGANALYLLYKLFKNLLQGKTLLEFFNGVFNLKSLLKFILLNESPFGSHLWYLGAIVYVLIIVFFFEKKWGIEKLYPLIPFLLLTDLFLGKYSLLIFAREFPLILVRNFLFVGLPYFLMGDLFYKIKPKIKSQNLIWLTILFVSTTLLERFVVGIFNVNATRDHYISTTFLAASVFLLAINCKNMVDNYFVKKICFVGSTLASSIYVLHPIIIDVISKIIRSVIGDYLIKVVFEYICPFLVFICSIIAAWVLYFGTQKLKRMRQGSKNID